MPLSQRDSAVDPSDRAQRRAPISRLRSSLRRWAACSISPQRWRKEAYLVVRFGRRRYEASRGCGRSEAHPARTRAGKGPSRPGPSGTGCGVVVMPPLSDHERRVLTELESELVLDAGRRRSRWRLAWAAVAVAVACLAMAAMITLSASEVAPSGIGAGLSAVLGLLTGLGLVRLRIQHRLYVANPRHSANRRWRWRDHHS
jgi:hypothetical protein